MIDFSALLCTCMDDGPWAMCYLGAVTADVLDPGYLGGPWTSRCLPERASGSS
ncbi:hypothetical protein EXN66_Car000793 [Channa argus]|uniref:Uncharacterized protein n=1 Tax=Channa argus TaxID=215402 RepID=A0A6G1QY51_CHAAH|nr:hypothetical protein EXN66_Car000793 [Channa argus]